MATLGVLLLVLFVMRIGVLGHRARLGKCERVVRNTKYRANAWVPYRAGSLFCLTGTSDKGPREYVVETIEKHGGKFHNRVRNDTDYLIVCAKGNPCWAYACYG